MPKFDSRAVRRIFEEWLNLFRRRNPERSHWPLPGTGADRARTCAQQVWKEIAADAALGEEIFGAVRKHVSEAPVAAWQQDLTRHRLDRAEDSRRGIQRPEAMPAFAMWFYAYAGGDSHRGDNPVPSKPLTVTATILVAQGTAHDVSAFQPVTAQGMLPVRAGQRVRLHIAPSQPACVYLLWVQPGGLVLPLFPWKGQTPDAEQNIPRNELLLPPDASWCFDDTPGLETLVAFASEEPLPKQTLLGLMRDFATLDPIRDVGDGPFADDLEAFAKDAGGAPARLNITHPRPVVDRSHAVRARHQHIARRLADRGVTGQCLSFRNAGREA